MSTVSKSVPRGAILILSTIAEQMVDERKHLVLWDGLEWVTSNQSVYLIASSSVHKCRTVSGSEESK